MKSEANDWKTKSLGELTAFITKGVPPAYANVSGSHTVYVLNQKCNRNFSLSYEQARLHDLSKKKIPDERFLKPGDVIINSTGTGTAGRIAQIWDIPSPTTIDGHMILMRPTDEIIPLYYGYALKAKQAQIESFAEGSTGQTEINRQRLCDEVSLTYPVNIWKQETIASILFALDNKITLNARINDNLRQQAQAIFKAWFIDFIPFENAQPESWTISTLRNVSTMGAGGDKPKKVSVNRTEDFPYPIYSNGISQDGLYGYTNDAKIYDESITVSARGTIGFVCLRHIPYVPIVRLVYLIPNTAIVSAKYLYLWLKNIHIAGTGTTQQQLTVPDFQKNEILIPDSHTMKRFTDIVTPLFEKIWENEQENENLSAIRDALLPRLMSGELDVSKLPLAGEGIPW